MKTAVQHPRSANRRNAASERETELKQSTPKPLPAPQLNIRATTPQNVLALQRSVGNRATRRWLDSNPKPAPAAAKISRSPSPQPVIQRYHQLDERDEHGKAVSQHFAGLKNNKFCKVAEDGSAVVPEDSHWIYATPTAVEVATKKLLEVRSALILELAPSKPYGALKRLSQLGGNQEPLLRTEPRPSPLYKDNTGIEPFQVKKGGTGFDTHNYEELCLAFPNSCRMTARAILTGNPKSATQGVFNTGDGKGLTEAHGASENDAEWALFGRDVRFHLAPKLFEIAEVPVSEQEEIAQLQGQALEDALGAVYLAMGKEKQKQFDALAGINASADARIGEAFVGAKDHDLMTQEERNQVPADSPRGHWGAVVMEAGSDRVTLEGLRLQAVGSTLQALHNRLWGFGMFGTRADVPEQTFNYKWGAQKGKEYTTMVVRGSDDEAQPGVIDYNTPIKKRREQEERARQMESELPELIEEVRMLIDGAVEVDEQTIRQALITHDYDTYSAYQALTQ